MAATKNKWTLANKTTRTPFKPGDRVLRLHGKMQGTVMKVTRVSGLTGNNTALVRVAWDNGHSALLADQQLKLAPWVVVDEEANPRVVVGRFDSEAEAMAFLEKQDPLKLARGGFGVDAPFQG